MSGETLIGLAVASGLLYWWVRHLRHLAKYPEIGCPRCHGAGWHTVWIFHVRSLRPRKVRGHCPKCHGKAWQDRRRQERWG